MPGAYVLSTSLWLPLPRPRVFDFFADAGNLERLTPPFLRFEIKTPLPIVLQTGTVIVYRIGLRGLPMTWESVISDWDPPRRFVDTQRRGPYREWIHVHTFEETEGGTTVGDQVRYSLPGWAFIGRLANTMVVKRDLHTIFEYRHRALQEALGVKGKNSEVVVQRLPSIPPSSDRTARGGAGHRT